MDEPQNSPLTEKQARFVQEYLIDLNGTQAAIRAGYSASSAAEIASQNLMKLNIQEAVQAGFHQRSERTKIDQDWVLKRLALMAGAKITAVASWDKESIQFKASEDLTDDEAYLISEVSFDAGKKKLKFVTDSTKQKALELIGKHLGMFEKDASIVIKESNGQIVELIKAIKDSRRD